MAEMKKYDHLSILIVEDDGPSRFYIQTVLKSIAGKVFTAENGALGLEIYKAHHFDIIVSDIGMPIMNGLDMSEKIKEIDPKAQIILTTAFDNRDSFLRAIDIGISQYILKPVNKEMLFRAIDRIDHVLQLEKELQEAHDLLETRVKERTAELRDTNQKLEAEIEVRKRTEHDLRIAKEVAEQANKAKSSFLAKVSHELRTPMNGIIGITSLLLATDIDEKQKKFLNMVKQSADNLLNIINDILDFSKIESGKLSINPIPMSISNVIEDTIDLHKQSILSKNLNLDVILDENLPETVIGDPGRLQQILVNLVGNAMKFTEKGGITLECKVLNKSKNKEIIRISVADTGIGIPKDKLHMLFKSFSQIDGSFTRKYGGTGLGLSISKELVEMMNGKINVESKFGKGSTFYFDIPFQINFEQKNTAKRNEELSVMDIAAKYPDFKARILVAEDSMINQEIIKKVLGLKSWDIMIASTGSEAVELYESMDFDLILMDVQMPEMDGIEATKKIRAIQKNNKRIPIIGLTAHGYEVHKNQCLAAGMDDYIIKPIDWDKTFATICKFMGFETNNDNDDDINISKMLQTIDGNKAVFNKIFDYFINNYLTELKELYEAIEQRDFYSIERMAHKLKSELGNFHSQNGIDAARNIEQMGKNKKIDKALSEFERLAEQMELIKEKLLIAKNQF